MTPRTDRIGTARRPGDPARPARRAHLRAAALLAGTAVLCAACMQAPGGGMADFGADRSATIRSGIGGAPTPRVARRSVDVARRIAELQAALSLDSGYTLDVEAEFLSADLHPGAMTLADAARLALAAGTEVRIARAQLAGQQGLAAATLRSLGPQVTLSGSLDQEIETSERPDGQTATTADVTLEISRPLLNLPRIEESRRQLNEIGTSKLSMENARSLATLAAANAYLSVVQSRLIIVYAEEQARLLDGLRTTMQARVEAGGASRADLQRIEARLDGVRAATSDLRAGLASSIAELVLLTDRRPRAIVLPGGIGAALPAEVDDAYALALGGNWELRATRNQVLSNEIRLREIAMRTRPTVDATLSQELGREWADTASSNRDTSIGISFNWTLYRNGMLDAELASAQASVEEFELRREAAEKALLRNLRESYILLRAMSEQRAAFLDQVSTSADVVAAFDEQFRETNRPLLDLFDAYQNLFQAKVNLTNLVITETRLNLQILHLLGELSADRLGKGN